MASITMTTSLLGGVSRSRQTSSPKTRRGLVTVKATGATEVDLNCNDDTKKVSNCGRRSLVSKAAAIAAAAAAAACSVVGVAFADEPKRGTPEAKKKYAAVCVTMPTARICRN